MLGAGAKSPSFPPRATRFEIETEMADIFQEVDEEVRRDRAAEFWRKHQNLIVGAAVVIVLAVGGFRYWRYENEKAGQAAGAQFQAAIAAVQAGQTATAYGDLAKLAAEGPEGYRALARMTEAGAKAASIRGRRSPPSTRSPAMRRSIRCCATPPGCAPLSCNSISPRTSRRAPRR